MWSDLFKGQFALGELSFGQVVRYPICVLILEEKTIKNFVVLLSSLAVQRVVMI